MKTKNLSKKHDSIKIDLETKTSELDKLKISSNSTNLDNIHLTNLFTEISQKYESSEKERQVLLNLLDEKEKQIEKLFSLEIENAELKAKSLLENFDNKPEESLLTKKSKKNIFSSSNTNANHKERSLNIVSINAGSQTSEKVYFSEHVCSLEQEILNINKKYEILKKEFQDHKDKSHKIIINNEENYKKLLKENEGIKKKIDELINEKEENIKNNNDKINKILVSNGKGNENANCSFEINNMKRRDSMNSFNQFANNFQLNEIEKQIINIEYLKNVLLKYLESIAVGNQFHIKLLENVIFAILSVSNKERVLLEEKRVRASFYYNLWYNTKSYLSAKIYGPQPSIEINENCKTSDISLIENLKTIRRNSFSCDIISEKKDKENSLGLNGVNN